MSAVDAHQHPVDKVTETGIRLQCSTDLLRVTFRLMMDQSVLVEMPPRGPVMCL